MAMRITLMAEVRGIATVRRMKLQDHVVDHLVAGGKARSIDKFGNDQADIGAALVV